MPYMTEEDKEKQVGGLILERVEVEKSLASLREEAARLATVYSDVGHRLVQEPENIIFERENHDVRFEGGRPIKANDVDGNRLLQLTNEIRSLIVKQSDLTQRLARLGIN